MFTDDVVVVLEVGRQRPLGGIKTSSDPLAFRAEDPDTLVLEDGSTVRL